MYLADRVRLYHRALAYRYQCNRAEIGYLLGRVAPGDVVFDIGAYRGGYLYWLRRAVGDGGFVYAFEPQPALYESLNRAVVGQGWENVVVEGKGVGERQGTLELMVPGAPGSTSPGAGFAAPVAGNAETCHRIPVEVTTLDHFVAEQGISRLDFLKLDVEGFEYEVFEGALGVLRELRPRLLFECEQRHLDGRTLDEVFALLQALGYRGFFFHRRRLRPLAEFIPARHQRQRRGRYWEHRDYVNNFVFVPGCGAGTGSRPIGLARDQIVFPALFVLHDPCCRVVPFHDCPRFLSAPSSNPSTVRA